ncbi:MAG: helix-turn-helix domain-containing protein [Deltaproteobacteria bacterium]|jgi:transcriptional regulator with XRE-family HTH domain|nr:helix-turn-helix domain-containing protein [Deltaproteobacteria bacterium]
MVQGKSQREFAKKVGLTAPFLNDLLQGQRYPSDKTRRKVAAALNYQGKAFEDFLDIGRQILQGSPINPAKKRRAENELLKSKGVLFISFAKRPKLDENNKIEIASTQDARLFFINGHILNRTSPDDLVAVIYSRNDMGDVAPKKSVIVVDLAQTTVKETDEEHLYLVCLYPKLSRDCVVRFLRPTNKPNAVMVLDSKKCPKSRDRNLDDIIIVGKIIMIYKIFN